MDASLSRREREVADLVAEGLTNREIADRLGALMLSGLLSVGIAIAPVYWLAVLSWGLSSCFANLFNINSGSRRQAIARNQMLGRVITIAMVLSVWTTPIGALFGGVAIGE